MSVQPKRKNICKTKDNKMNKLQAKLSTFFIKDKEKRAFIEKLITDKFFYNNLLKTTSYNQYKEEGKVDLSICAIMKNEAPYVKEWLDYHLLVGVKRFYIYDNESEDNLKEKLKPYIDKGIVIYKYQPGECQQQVAYEECLQQHGTETKWMAYIDTDEFIIPLKNKTIPEFLKDYTHFVAVGINWTLYDSNDHYEKPSGGVLENYTRVYFDENTPRNQHIKTICQPALTLHFRHPHYGIYKEGYFAVNENYEKIEGPFSIVYAKKIRINHYYCKSFAEYKAKISRGMADHKKNELRTLNQNDYIYPNYKYDYVMWKFVATMQGHYLKEWLKYIKCKIKNIPLYISNFYLNKEFTYNYFIDEEYYKKNYPEYIKDGMSIAQHYLNIGWKKGYNPSAKFNTKFYLDEYPDVEKSKLNPLWHYIQYGQYGNKKTHK